MTTTRKYESTEVGEQSLIDGIRPVTLGEKLTARTSHPMTPRRNPNVEQKPCDHGLFDGDGQVRAPVQRSPRTPCFVQLFQTQTKLNQQWRLP